jgi:hypothetical protein
VLFIATVVGTSDPTAFTNVCSPLMRSICEAEQWFRRKSLRVSGRDCPNAILVLRIVKDCVWTSMLEM